MKRIRLNDTHIILLKTLTHAICLYLLANVYYLGFTDQLGGDPAKAIIHFTGKGALNLLLLTLLVAPLSRWTHQNRLMRMRRLLGLYSFAWAVCHLFNYLTFDLQFDAALIAKELVERPYIVVGMTTFLILLALAITSIPKLVRAMGRRWRQLHSLIYLAVILTCVHYWWSVKADVTEPAIYLAITLVMLSFKRRPLHRLASGLSQRLLPART